MFSPFLWWEDLEKRFDNFMSYFFYRKGRTGRKDFFIGFTPTLCASLRSLRFKTKLSNLQIRFQI